MYLSMLTHFFSFMQTWLVPSAYAFIGFCLLIVMHEFGHFLFCKLFNIHTPTFSIGMGPKLFEKKIGKTNFRLSLLPLGGYVEIAGNAEVGQGEQAHAESMDSTSFATKAYWQKMLVLCGGILFNIMFAYIAMCSILYIGLPKSDVFIASLEKNMPASKADIQQKDRLLAWDDTNIAEDSSQLSAKIQRIQNGDARSAQLLLERAGKQHTVSINLPAQKEDAKPRLGIEFEMLPSTSQIEQLPFTAAIKEGIKRTNELIVKTTKGILGLFSRGTLKDGAGPIMILAHSAKLASQSIAYLLWFLVFISVNLAIINLIPVPVMDGGQIMYVTIETILRKSIPLRIKNAINMGSAALLLTLFLIFSYNDVKRLLFKQKTVTAPKNTTTKHDSF